MKGGIDIIDVSIIVPVYNAEKYLEKSVKSMRGQTHRNLEIILVDDGSTDASPALCQSIAREDARVRVIRQENAGPGAARNTGIEAARGEYVYFADADDWLDPNLVEIVLGTVRDAKADIAVFGVRDAVESADGKVEFFGERLPAAEGCFTYDEFWERFAELDTAMSLWMRMFRRRYLLEKGLRLNDMRNGEDGYFILEGYLRGFERIVYLRKALYTYLHRPASATLNYNPIRGDAEYRLACRYGEVLESIPQAKGRFGYQIARFSLNKLTIFITCVVSDPDMTHAQKTMLLRDYARRENVREALSNTRASASFSRVQKIKFTLLRLGFYSLVIHLAKPWRYR